MPGRYAPLGEYGVIGDLHTVALVGMDGSIDFLCLPRFDSPSVFAALVDAERGGRFQIAPLLQGPARKQLYLPDTNVLLTRSKGANSGWLVITTGWGVAVAVAASRVLLGVHWLTDVIGGLALGWAWFTLCSIAFGGRRGSEC